MASSAPKYSIDPDQDPILDSFSPASPSTSYQRNRNPRQPQPTSLFLQEEEEQETLDSIPSNTTSDFHSLSALDQLTLFWSNQSNSPELLPYPTTTITHLLSQIDQQQSILDSLIPFSSSSSEDEYLRLNLVSLDLDRCKWLLQRTLSLRISLLQSHLSHYIATTPSELEKLSESEKKFVIQFWNLSQQVFRTSVLDFLPPSLRELDSSTMAVSGSRGLGNMIVQPDLDRPVFVRCLQDCGSIRLPDGESVNLTQDSIHFLRYRTVRYLVYQHRVQLQ